MKQTLFKTIAKDQTVSHMTQVVFHEGDEMWATEWWKDSGLEPGANPDDWEDSKIRISIWITVPEYQLLRTARKVATDMVKARKAQKNSPDVFHVRNRDQGSSS